MAAQSSAWQGSLLLDTGLWQTYAIPQASQNHRIGVHFAAAWGDVPPVRAACTAAWGRSGPAASLRMDWRVAETQKWHHALRWRIPFALSHQAVHGLRLAASSKLSYGELGRHSARHVAAWHLTEPTSVRHLADWSVSTTDPVHARNIAAWSLMGTLQMQAVANTPEMIWHGIRIRLIAAELTADEDSPVWLAKLELARISDFAAIGITDPVSITIGLETFNLVVDGKTLSRDAPGAQRMEITAVSPVALLDAPFTGVVTYYDSRPRQARSVVEDLIGTVDWRLPDWIIPAGALMLANVTPLAAARNIVNAIGGIIESNPDGSVVCRRRHPVSIPDYGTATVDHSLFDADVISTQAQIAPRRGYNRVVVSNEIGQAASKDRLEYIDLDGKSGVVRAWLGTDRPVVLAHTGHPSTGITPLGSITRSETETVEFVDGKSSVRYPVTSVTSVVWQHTNLGSVTASGQTLTADVGGYSLAQVTYTTTAMEWQVSLAVSEEVQFVLIDR